MTRFIITALMFFCFSVAGMAQATASFTASVTIIQPIGITTTSNMNFAAVDAKSGGAVILTPDNYRITSGGVVLEDATNVSAATFEITGEQDFSFSITLPQEEYVLTNGSENMILRDFTSNLAENNRLSGESNIVRVGATLQVAPNQTPGTYTSSGAMNVTVNYN